MKRLEFHPLSEVFPLLEGAALDELAASIKEHGQQEPIGLWEGRILDGRNRFLACEKAGVKPWTVTLERSQFEELSPLEWVVAKNLHRRQMDASQRAMVAARLKPLFSEQAANRMKQGVSSDPRANLPEGRTRDLAGETLNVSGRSVADAEVVIDRGSKALQHAVEAGEVAVSAAAKIAKTVPKSEQLKVAREPKKRKPLPEAKPAVDKDGKAIPKELEDVFLFAPQFGEQRRAISKIKSWLKMAASADSPVSMSVMPILQQVTADLNNAARALRFATPAAVCPYCKNKKPAVANCDACKRQGWVTEGILNASPGDDE